MKSIYHYTSSKSLNGIICKEGVVFFATRFDGFEDKLEYVWARDFISPYLKSMAQEEGKKYESDFTQYPFIISFCKNENDAFMLEHYGKKDHSNENSDENSDESYGVELILDSDEIKKYGSSQVRWLDIFQEVEYSDNNEKSLKAAIKRAYGSYQYPSDDPVADYNEIACLIKQKEKFAKEKEVRYLRVYHDVLCLQPDGTEESKDETPEILFRKKSIPYIKIVFPKSVLQGIIIRCHLDFNSEEEKIKLLLKDREYPNDVKSDQSL